MAGTAIETPAYLAALPELVAKRDLQSALAANGVGINIARIVGPGLDGILIGVIGVGAVLAINAATFTVLILAYARLPPAMRTSDLPAERLVAAIRHGVRFVGASPELKATLVRAVVFFLFASSYWALLPLVARDQLGGGANTFGVLFGCQGGER